MFLFFSFLFFFSRVWFCPFIWDIFFSLLILFDTLFCFYEVGETATSPSLERMALYRNNPCLDCMPLGKLARAGVNVANMTWGHPGGKAVNSWGRNGLRYPRVFLSTSLLGGVASWIGWAWDKVSWCAEFQRYPGQLADWRCKDVGN